MKFGLILQTLFTVALAVPEAKYGMKKRQLPSGSIDQSVPLAVALLAKGTTAN